MREHIADRERIYTIAFVVPACLPDCSAAGS
jgi:hypothetical protein